MTRTVFPITRMRLARVLLKGPMYRSIARSGQKAQSWIAFGQNAPTIRRRQSESNLGYRQKRVHMCETLWAVLITVSNASFIVTVLSGVLSGASPHKMAWVVYEKLEFSARFVRLTSDLLDASVRRIFETTYLCLMRSNRFVTFPFPSEVELSCRATCGRVLFVRLIHVDGEYIAGQNNCAIRNS